MRATPSQARSLKRRAFFVDDTALKRARRALGAESDAEAIRLSLERVAEMDEFWRMMDRTRGALAKGEFERP